MEKIKKFFNLEFRLFFLLVSIQAAFFLTLILQKRLPNSHDTFHFFSLQYYYLNHAVMYGAIPQWIPFLTHGLIANGFYALQCGFLQNVLMAAAPFLSKINFLPVFYAGMFVDELLLVVGTWLLAKRFFSSLSTVFFVCISVVGSSVWVTQPWFNFRFLYTVPLMIYFFHLFLESAKWRYFFLGFGLMAFQTLGNLAYSIPFTSVFIFMYFLFYTALNFRNVLAQAKQIKFNFSLLIPALWVIALFVLCYSILSFGTDEVMHYGFNRNRDGTVSLGDFLDASPLLARLSPDELLFGALPSIDYSLYAGVAAVYFAIAGAIANRSRNKIVFVLLAIFIMLFSQGAFVSMFFYYVWPMMKYFRHIELTMSFFRLSMCFLAGFGFEWLLVHKTETGRAHVFIASVCFIASLGYFILGYGENSNGFLILIIGTLFSFFLLFDRKKWHGVTVVLLLMLHSVDIFAYKWTEFEKKSFLLNEQQYEILKFSKIPFVSKRDQGYSGREPILGDLLQFVIRGGNYWTIYAFLFKDDFDSYLQTHQWMLPLDQYLRAYAGVSIYDRQSVPIPTFRINRALVFPRSSSLQKISSLTEDKIQFFSDAHILGSPDEVAGLMTDPQFKGDLLFLNQPGHDPKPFNRPLDSNERLNLDYEVTHFDSNQIQVSVNIPGNQPAWIFYSDVWHPFWKVIVNGKTKTVYKADLAYKAAPLEPGQNNIRFYFESNWISFLHLFFNLHAVFWLLILCLLIAKICVPEGRQRGVKIYELI